MAGDRPTACHLCGTPVVPDPARPGWLTCPVCGPAWMPAPGQTHWIRISIPAGAEQRLTDLGIGLILLAQKRDTIHRAGAREAIAA